eukprot:c3616_g1_i1.p1 GENE.c3616_g1_i1~~c3616_g1_i1.p1  ORF type:complete len:351 (+),score=85.95 c3616_g1_i1:672-1724(+)
MSSSNWQYRATVEQAAAQMKLCHTSAVLVMSDQEDKLMGIFTTKDILIRVVAKSLSTDTKVVKVMTVFPQTIPATTTVLDALEIMHQKRFLHLPVVDAREQVLGLVDVLQLTLNVVDPEGESESQSAWPSMFQLAIPDDDVLSTGDQSEIGESASVVASTLLGPVPDQSVFQFKIRSPDEHTTYRITSAVDSISALHEAIASKMKIPTSDLSKYILTYTDDEADTIAIDDDSDLKTAVEFARSNEWACLALSLNEKGQKKALKSQPHHTELKHDPTPVRQPEPVAAPVAPVTQVTPPPPAPATPAWQSSNIVWVSAGAVVVIGVLGLLLLRGNGSSQPSRPSPYRPPYSR